MGFEVAYDPGENIKIVKAVEKYPVLYDSKKFPAIEFRGVSDKAWALVAKELGVSEGYVKQRWTNIRGCFKRYLRKKAASSSTKTYYLADYLQFMLPFMNIDNRLMSTNERNQVMRYDEASSEGSSDGDLDTSNEFELKLVDSDGEEESYYISTNSEQISERDTETGRDPDWDFFSSLLPDVKRMTSAQKVKFQNAILGAIDTALYGDDF